MGLPGVVSLSGGFPPPQLFPIESISLRLRGGQTVTIDSPPAVRLARAGPGRIFVCGWRGGELLPQGRCGRRLKLIACTGASGRWQEGGLF